MASVSAQLRCCREKGSGRPCTAEGSWPWEQVLEVLPGEPGSQTGASGRAVVLRSLHTARCSPAKPRGAAQQPQRIYRWLRGTQGLLPSVC